MSLTARFRAFFSRRRDDAAVKKLLGTATDRGRFDPDRDSQIFLIPGSHTFKVSVSFLAGATAGTRSITIRCDRRTPPAAIVAYAARVVAAALPADATLRIPAAPVEIVK